MPEEAGVRRGLEGESMHPRAHGLITAIYQAPLHADGWLPSLDQFAHAFDSVGSAIIVIDKLNRPGLSVAAHNSGIPDEITHAYQNHYSKYEREVWERIQNSSPFEIIRDVDVWTDDVVYAKRPDVVFLRNSLGIGHRFGVKVSSTPAYMTAVTAQYHKSRGHITDDERHLCQLILPHFAQAVEIDRTFRDLRALSKALASALDHLLFGVVILSAQGSKIFANKAAGKFVAEKDGVLITRDGRLTPTSENAQRAFEAALQLTDVRDGGPLNNDPNILALPRRNGKTPILCEVYPILDEQDEFDSSHVCSIVFLIDPDDQDIVSLGGLSQVCGLSSAEAEVVGLIIDGLSNNEIAESRRVKAETIKAQVASILRKTETRNRTELVRQALRVELPIIRDTTE